MVIAILCLAFLGCNETKDMSYPTLNSAERAHMIEKGWIPVFTPRDATNIKLNGDLDLGRVYGTFSSSDAHTIEEHCNNTTGPIRRPLQAPNWFPPELAKVNQASDLVGLGFTVLTCVDGHLTVAILKSNNQVYYWN
jgi:hypothetical protein